MKYQMSHPDIPSASEEAQSAKIAARRKRLFWLGLPLPWALKYSVSLFSQSEDSILSTFDAFYINLVQVSAFTVWAAISEPVIELWEAWKPSLQQQLRQVLAWALSPFLAVISGYHFRRHAYLRTVKVAHSTDKRWREGNDDIVNPFIEGLNIEDVYVQLSLSREGVLNQERKDIWRILKEHANDLLVRHGRSPILISGVAGSGKTTLMRHIALRTAKSWWKHGIVPISISAPRAAQHVGLLSALDAQPTLSSKKRMAMFLRAYYEAPEKDLLWFQWILKHNCVILLDSLDEIDIDSVRSGLLSSMVLECSAVRRWQLIVASRPAGLSGAETANCRRYEVREFESEEWKSFVDGWFRAYATNSPVRAQPWWLRWRKVKEAKTSAKAVQLIRIIEGGGSHMSDLSKNPLLLTMLTWLYSTGVEVPRRRVELYRNLVDALMKKSEMQDDRVFPLLQYLAWRMMESGSKRVAAEAVMDTDSICDALVNDQTKRHQSLISLIVGQLIGGQSSGKIEARALRGPMAELIKEIRIKTSLLHDPEKKGEWRFVHKTFREYFVALLWHQHPNSFPRSEIGELVKNQYWSEAFCLYAALSKDEARCVVLAKAVLTAAASELSENRTHVATILAAKLSKEATSLFSITGISSSLSEHLAVALNKVSGHKDYSQLTGYELDRFLDHRLLSWGEDEAGVVTTSSYGYFMFCGHRNYPLHWPNEVKPNRLDANSPITGIAHCDAQQFVSWLNEVKPARNGLGYRLPTQYEVATHGRAVLPPDSACWCDNGSLACASNTPTSDSIFSPLHNAARILKSPPLAEALDRELSQSLRQSRLLAILLAVCVAVAIGSGIYLLRPHLVSAWHGAMNWSPPQLSWDHSDMPSALDKVIPHLTTFADRIKEAMPAEYLEVFRNPEKEPALAFVLYVGALICAVIGLTVAGAIIFNGGPFFVGLFSFLVTKLFQQTTWKIVFFPIWMAVVTFGWILKACKKIWISFQVQVERGLKLCSLGLFNNKVLSMIMIRDALRLVSFNGMLQVVLQRRDFRRADGRCDAPLIDEIIQESFGLALFVALSGRNQTIVASLARHLGRDTDHRRMMTRSNLAGVRLSFGDLKANELTEIACELYELASEDHQEWSIQPSELRRKIQNCTLDIEEKGFLKSLSKLIDLLTNLKRNTLKFSQNGSIDNIKENSAICKYLGECFNLYYNALTRLSATSHFGGNLTATLNDALMWASAGRDSLNELHLRIEGKASSEHLLIVRGGGPAMPL
ncbi:NACHT domain-containing protein [Brevifollis gellanilyticus]|nr:NACHT domain-containing protein [Brevifollis gellanilyticus]